MKPFNRLFVAQATSRNLAISATFLLLLSVPASAADYYFDVNGTDLGSGVVNGASYAGGGGTWNSVADGTGTPGGTVGTAFRGHTLVFSAGTDAAGSSYTMTGFGTSYQMTGVRIEDGNVSLVGGSGYSSPTILTKTGSSLNISGNWDFYGNWNSFNTEASSSVTFANLPNVSTRTVKLRKNGDGLLTIDGAATGRSITVEALGGELRIRNGNALWTSGYTSTVTVNGGTLSLDNNITVANNPVTVGGTGYDNKGAILNHAGNNSYNSLITLAAAATIKSNVGTTLTLNPTTGSAVTGSFGLTFGGAGTINVSKPIDAVTSLAKNDGGTLTLTAQNTYTGATTLNSGALVLSGSGSISASTTIEIKGGAILDTSSLAGWGLASGQTLKGEGSLNAGGTGKTVIISSGAYLAPGGSAGSLSINGDLSLASNSTIAAEIQTSGSPTSDLVNLDGNLTIISGALLDLGLLGTDVTLTPGTKFSLFSYSGTWNSGIFTGYAANSDFSLGLNDFRIRYDDDTAGVNGGSHSNFVTLTVIPEPATALLGGLALLVPLLRKRCHVCPPKKIRSCRS